MKNASTPLIGGPAEDAGNISAAAPATIKLANPNIDNLAGECSKCE